MSRCFIHVLLLLLCGPVATLNLQLPTKARATFLSRRTALAGLVGLPSAAVAAEFTGYKTRDYGNGANTATGAKERPDADSVPCGKGVPGCRPDGFGGFERRDKPVKPLAKQVLENVVGDEDSAPPPPRKAAAPAPPPPPKASSTASSSKPLTMDEMVANSISNKEAFLGRQLTEAEKVELADKLKKLMGS